MFYNLIQRFHSSCSLNSVEQTVWISRRIADPEPPEFYGTDAVDKRAYGQLRVRKLGRYVRIFPRNPDPDARISCMQVEIFGELYIKIYQDVFFIHDEQVMSYKKGRPTKFEGNDTVVEEYKNPMKLTTRISDGLLHYTKIVPSLIPWEGELSVDACVIAPNPVKGRKDFLAGRVHKVYEGKNKYAVKYLASKRAVVSKKVVFKREQLQVVYGAWCKIIARVHLKTSKRSWCRGDILQVDAQITFRSTALHGLKRLSVDELKNIDYVSQEKVVFEKLEKGKTILFFESSFDKCLRAGTLLNYYRDSGLLQLAAFGPETHPFKRLNEVHYAKNSTVFDRCGEDEKTCWKSRIPFSGVTRLNCSASKIWKDNDCRDENECRTGMANCGHLAACKNSQDFYKCVCPKGTVGKGYAWKRPCLDVDECNTGNACGEGAVCINTPRSFRCYCKQGFKINGFNRCQDIDECQVPANKINCEKHKNVLCKNIPGSFQCVCKAGYQGAYKDCKDEDECNSGKHECSPHADCSNTVGSYVCKCKKGFSGGGRLCADLIECDDLSKSGVCHSTLAKCVDFPGGYKCECKVGYHGDGIKNCKLADECDLGIHKCHQWATCVNTQKSYDCSCNKGYEGNGFTCKDVDECASNQNDCDFKKDSVECVNTNGSYMCACPEGFTWDGKTCTNIDECKTGAHDCAKNAICTDREGSFSCKCTPGFYGNATEKCIDVDECLNGMCKYTGQTCINSLGSFECKCMKGFSQVDYLPGEDMCQDGFYCILHIANSHAKVSYLEQSQPRVHSESIL
ncbi:PREDICTED: fibulin-1-like [Acropora digitifera]|uniref:fibulin-1-like n=1 Tax=Acropora digitifera TaxID=70779 RepID=UPI00077A7CBD|nr:PREDICTED: fibulin-1-like [Acropora digitifera]